MLENVCGRVGKRFAEFAIVREGLRYPVFRESQLDHDIDHDDCTGDGHGGIGVTRKLWTRSTATTR